MRSDVRTTRGLNQFDLKGDGAFISYTTQDISGNPQLSYKDETHDLNFLSREIDHQQSRMGTLVTVILEEAPDLHTLTLTLVMPAIDPDGPVTRFKTLAVRTTHHQTIAGPGNIRGPIQTYAVLNLDGEARRVESKLFPQRLETRDQERTGSRLFGVVEATVENPRVAYLAEPQPVTEDLLALAGPVEPTELFRFAAPCAGAACRHFDGEDCRLARRVVQIVAPMVEALPPCRVRPTCRWWLQEGKQACLRCPVVVTETCRPSPALRQAADPEAAA